MHAKRTAWLKGGGLAPSRGRSRLPSMTAPGSAEAPRARVGPQDAFRGAVGKDLGVPLRVEGRARNLRGPHPARRPAWRASALAKINWSSATRPRRLSGGRTTPASTATLIGKRWGCPDLWPAGTRRAHPGGRGAGQLPFEHEVVMAPEPVSHPDRTPGVGDSRRTMRCFALPVHLPAADGGRERASSTVGSGSGLRWRSSS